MLTFNALCHYVEAAENVEKHFDSDLSTVVFALRQFMMFTQELDYFIFKGVREHRRDYVAYNDVYDRLLAAQVGVPGSVKVALNGLFARYLGANAMHDLWALPPSQILRTYNTDHQRIQLILSWCKETGWLETFANYYRHKHDELSIREAAKPYCVDLAQQAQDIEQGKVECIRRSALLWELASKAPAGWVAKAKAFAHGLNVYDGAIYTYATVYGVRVGHLYVGLDIKQRIRFSASADRLDSSLTFRPIAPVRSLRDAIKSLDTLRLAILHHALLDCNDGDTLEDYVARVHLVLYLVALSCHAELDAFEYKQLKLWFPRLFTQNYRASLLSTGETVEPGTKVDLDMCIARIERPKFERYKDKAHRHLYEFDYITVDIAIVSKYAAVVKDAIRSSRSSFKQLIMAKIAASPKMRGKELLIQLLHVKEVIVCNGGLTVTVLVEFKPGVEEALEGLSKMQLQ